jgi:pentalenene oxygenase
VLGDGLGTCPHASHHYRRRLVQPAFSLDRIRRYADLMNRQIASRLSTWRDGQIIDAKAQISEITCKLAANTMFAADLATETVSEILPCLAVLFEGLFMRMTAPLPLMEKLPTPANRRFNVALARLNMLVYKVVAAYRHSNVDHGDLLSMLLAAQDDSGASLSDRQIRDEVVTMFLAGTETIASLTNWALYFLAEYPEVQKRLQAEIDTAVDERGAVAFDDLPNLQLTRNVLNESIRLFPPGWMFTRVTTAPVELTGSILPVGATILYSPYLIHRRPDAFQDPDLFNPDRWLPESPAPARGAYIPFGGGTRRCVGDIFGLTEAALIIAQIASRWSLESVPGVRIKPLTRGTLQPNRLPLRLHRRTRSGNE